MLYLLQLNFAEYKYNSPYTDQISRGHNAIKQTTQTGNYMLVLLPFNRTSKWLRGNQRVVYLQSWQCSCIRSIWLALRLIWRLWTVSHKPMYCLNIVIRYVCVWRFGEHPLAGRDMMVSGFIRIPIPSVYSLWGILS